MTITIPTPTGPVTQTIDYTGDFFGATGDIDLSVFGFLTASASFTFQTQTLQKGGADVKVATMSLTDSYAYFYNRRSLMFPQGTWYSQRAFAPPERI